MTSTKPSPSPRPDPPNMRPSIEKKYGKSIDEWMKIISTSPLTKRLELTNWLKADYGVGHGHAMWLVHNYLSEQEAAAS
jgi:hypothetical protein